MYMVTVTAFVLWSIYGFLIGSWPIVVFNLLSLVLSGIILGLKIHNDREKSSKESHASASRREPGMARPG
jgi:MtN3 and saliva related transmembrane protein